MADSIRTMQDNIERLQYNPAGIVENVLQTLQDVRDGQILFVDATNPVVATLESGAVMVSAFLEQQTALARRLYVRAAQTPEDVYLHMSDKDYPDRFAQPASAPFEIYVGKEELFANLVEDPTNPGVSRLTIPRNTYIKVAQDVVFSLQYPIEIRRLRHGGLQYTYGTDKPSPLYALPTNVLDAEEVIDENGQTLVRLTALLHQFKIDSQQAAVTRSKRFEMRIPFTDQFYYARVYMETSTGGWQEIGTTHSDQIYDIMKLTAALKVLPGELQVVVPQIYLNNGLLNRMVRVDVYTTRGPMTTILGNYVPTDFETTFISYDKNEIDEYVAPLRTLKTFKAWSKATVSGGANAVAFEELRSRVVHNAVGDPTLPITDAQIENSISRRGYDIVKNVDVVTKRTFLATRSLPAPTDKRLITSAAATIVMLSTTIEKAVQLSTVIDNGESVTITPDTLYKLDGGVLRMVTVAELAEILALPADKRALRVTNGNFLYTPFHYVLDTSDGQFDVRPYYLDAPVIESRSFVDDNDLTNLQVSTGGGFVIDKTTQGYRITIQTKSSEEFRALPDDQVFVQLAYTPANEKDRAYLMGTLTGKTETGEREYVFELTSNLNVDAGDNLQLTSFKMYDTEERVTGAGLLTQFDVLFATTAVMPTTWQPKAVDLALGAFLLPPKISGVQQDRLKVRFGYTLNQLWARARTTIEPENYKRYTVDVPRYYEEDVYDRDPVTGSAVKIVNGEVQVQILHHKGDEVRDTQGNIVYQYRIGDVMKDEDGRPVLASPRGLQRQIDLMLIEGAYWFATDVAATQYRAALTKSLVDWITNDLSSIEKALLDETYIYFYPKTTLGIVPVMISGGLKTSVNAGQAFSLTMYVSSQVNGNEELKDTIKRSTINLIAQELTNGQVSMSRLTDSLREAYGSDVMSFSIAGLGGDANLNVLTVLDDSSRCGLRKRLVAQADGTLIVEEDVTLSWVVHELKN